MFVRTSRVALRRTIVVLDPGHGDVQFVVAVRSYRPRAFRRLRRRVQRRDGPWMPGCLCPGFAS